MNRVYKLATLAVTLLMVMTLAPVSSAQDAVTLKLWTTVKPEGTTQAMVDLFMEKNPNIIVEWEEFPWSDSEWALRLTTALAANDLPDVIVAPQVGISWYIQGFLQPFNDLVERDEIDMDLWSEAWLNLSIFNDDIIGLPFEGSAMLLYYNADLLTEAGVPLEPPADWDELLDYADKLVKRDDAGKLTQVGYVADFGGQTRLTLYMYGNGGGFFTPDCKAPRLNDPKNVEALEWYVNTYDRVGGAEEVLAFLEGVGGDANAAFYSGRVGMIASGTGLAQAIATNAPDLNWGVWPHPVNKGVEYTTLGGINQAMMPVTVEGAQREAAWELIKFFALDYEANVLYVEKTNTLSLLPGISEEFKDNPALALALNLVTGPMSPWNPNPISDNTVYVERSTATDLALRHTMSAQEALDQAQANLQIRYDEILADLAAQGITDFKMTCR